MSEPARVPFPVSRTIFWRPRAGDARGGPTGTPAGRAGRPARVCITQTALARLERDILEPNHPGIGFLLGELYFCPVNAVLYGVIEVADPWPRPADELLRAPPSIRALREAAAVAGAARGRRVLGWFHVRGHLATELERDDERVHRHVLTEPWQATLLFAPGAQGPSGAFYVLAADGRRCVVSPFYEVLAESGAPAAVGALHRTSCVTWPEYDPAEPVTLLGAAARRALADGSRKPPAPPAPAPPSAVGPGRAAPGHASATPAAAPTSAAAPGDRSPSAPPALSFPLYVPPRKDAPASALTGRRRRSWRGRRLAAAFLLSLVVSVAGAVALIRRESAERAVVAPGVQPHAPPRPRDSTPALQPAASRSSSHTVRSTPRTRAAGRSGAAPARTRRTTGRFSAPDASK